MLFKNLYQHFRALHHVLVWLLLVFLTIGSIDKSYGFRIPQNSFKELDIAVSVPEIIIANTETEISISVNPDHHTLKMRNNKLSFYLNDSILYDVVMEDGEGSFKHIFSESDKGFSLYSSNKADLYRGYYEVSPLPIKGWMSLIPPLIAILMALVFREVITSLFLGVLIGSILLYVYIDGGIGILTGLLAVFDTYIIEALVDSDHMAIIVFSMTIGAMVAVISRNGGMAGVVKYISKFAKNARSGQLATWFLGIAIFFDDYANTLVVGNTMRPVTDKLKISREKLSYLVDSTAAPVASIAFVTTWIGYELAQIADGIKGTPVEEGTYSIFLHSLSYAFYPILALIFMFFLIWKQRDFGPMLKAERKARLAESIIENGESDSELKEFSISTGAIPKAYNAVIPILVLLVVTIIGLIATAWDPEVWNSTEYSVSEKISIFTYNTNSYTALLWASFSSLFVALLMTIAGKGLNLKKSIEAALGGYKTMLSAILILVLAWSLASLTDQLHTAEYLTGALKGNIAPWLLPTLTFIMAGAVAFSTGSSWSTMAILYPLMLPATITVCIDAGMSQAEYMPIFYNVVSCVLAGSVFGDHCSPISDTTILSSLASSCDHIQHVRTQLPYALTVGVVGILIGTIPGALGLSSWITFPLGIVILYAIVHFVGKKTDPSGA